MPEGTHAHGTIIKMSGVALAKLLEITPPKPKVDDIKETHMDSPDKAHQHAPGLIEPGTCTLVLLYAKAQHATLMSSLRLTKTWTILFPDGSTLVFSAYISENGLPVDMGDDLKTEITMQVSGLPVFTAA